jgi:hypothetical protein
MFKVGHNGVTRTYKDLWNGNRDVFEIEAESDFEKAFTVGRGSDMVYLSV